MRCWMLDVLRSNSISRAASLGYGIAVGGDFAKSVKTFKEWEERNRGLLEVVNNMGKNGRDIVTQIRRKVKSFSWKGNAGADP